MSPSSLLNVVVYDPTADGGVERLSLEFDNAAEQDQRGEWAFVSSALSDHLS
jgi:hypothetical protein